MLSVSHKNPTPSVTRQETHHQTGETALKINEHQSTVGVTISLLAYTHVIWACIHTHAVRSKARTSYACRHARQQSIPLPHVWGVGQQPAPAGSPLQRPPPPETRPGAGQCRRRPDGPAARLNSRRCCCSQVTACHVYASSVQPRA